MVLPNEVGHEQRVQEEIPVGTEAESGNGAIVDQ